MNIGAKRFQEKLISYLINSKDTIKFDIMPYLKAEHFENAKTRELFEKVQGYFEQYKTLISQDYLGTLCTDEQLEYLNSICAVELKGSAEEDIKTKTLEFVRKQVVKNLMLDISENIDSPLVKFDTIKKRLIEKVVECDFNADQELDVKEDFDDVVGAERIATSTGWPRVDDLLNGGVANGELCLVAAPPGGGKSHTLISATAEAWRCFKNDDDVGIYFTMELADHIIKTRLAGHISSIPFNTIRDSAEERAAAKIAVNKFKGTIKVKEYAGGTADVGMLHSYLEKLKAQGYRIRFIAVDYPEEMALNQRDLRLSITNLYTQLRALGHKSNFDCPVWVASQINRENSEEQVITAKGLAEAFSKAGKVDVLFSLTATHLALLKNRAAGKDHIVFDSSMDTETSTLTVSGKGEPLSNYLVKNGVDGAKIESELKKLAKKYVEESKSEDPKVLD